MVRPWKAGNYLKNRQLVRFRIVWMVCIRDNHEMRRAKAPRTVRCPAPSDVVRTRLWEIIKLLHSYLVRLRLKTVSNTKD